MGGWRVRPRRKSWRVYELIMGAAMAVVLAAALIRWALGWQ
ncbi:MAG TPA: hypothetical protein VGK74_02840 [Symbiobacteriaceae bacterium]